jgi:hypothetical protein
MAEFILLIFHGNINFFIEEYRSQNSECFWVGDSNYLIVDLQIVDLEEILNPLTLPSIN